MTGNRQKPPIKNRDGWGTVQMALCLTHMTVDLWTCGKFFCRWWSPRDMMDPKLFLLDPIDSMDHCFQGRKKNWNCFNESSCLKDKIRAFVRPTVGETLQFQGVNLWCFSAFCAFCAFYNQRWNMHPCPPTGSPKQNLGRSNIPRKSPSKKNMLHMFLPKKKNGWT